MLHIQNEKKIQKGVKIFFAPTNEFPIMKKNIVAVMLYILCVAFLAGKHNFPTVLKT